MDLFSRFKKDYFNYLISIILPAAITGLSIPLFKHVLGAKGYGSFALWYNAVLILSAVLSGWITQSIIRFFPTSKNQNRFAKGTLEISLKTQLAFFVPVFCGFLYFSHSYVLSLFCLLALFVSSLQFTIAPILQAAFLSKKIIFSELIRTASYILVALCFLLLTHVNYLYSLFLAVIISYLFSLVYLQKQSNSYFKISNSENIGLAHEPLFKKFLKYGGPLSFWFVFAYLLSYIDKIFILKNFGGEMQGNYQAIFDLISKSIVLIISPIITSVFPILTSAYQVGNNSEIRNLLKKIIKFELIGYVVVSTGYWLFGSDILFFLLKIPDTATYRMMGFLVITGSFIWQVGILIQKRFELRMQSFVLLILVIIAFAVQLLFYLLFGSSGSELIYPIGFVLSATVYVLLISFTELRVLIKSVELVKIKRVYQGFNFIKKK
ncbi:MAG: oligosaccharide flippase family protein [Bacteroidetes bacterium]|nr:oligosaccharide flippase family protein [Bacteroidota bacterium]